MTIEFQTPYGKVSEKLVNDIRNKMLGLSHINKEIWRAEVLLKEEETIVQGENRVCGIRLIVYGDDLFVHARTGNFKNSAKEAIGELRKMVNRQVKKQKEPRNEMTRTGKVKLKSFQKMNLG